MAPFAISAIAFAAFAVAIPHRSHQHLHRGVVRSNDFILRTENLAPIAGRSDSYDGSCGAWSGQTCGAGSCCGANGWCGNTTEHCGAGCQSAFGQCGSSFAAASPASYNVAIVSAASDASSPSSTEPSSGNLEVSPNGYCGTQHGFTCQGSNFGDSCSKWGYCGSNSSYSGNGCQPEYGSCDGSVVAATLAASSSAESATVSSSTVSEAFSSSGAAIPTKAPAHPPSHSAWSYAAPSTTLITKAQPSSTQAATSAPVETSAPAYSAPPSVYTSSIETTSASSASQSSAEATSQAPASSYSSSEQTSSASAPPSYSSSAPSSSATGGTYIKTFKGDGSSTAGWPSQDEWLSSDDLWAINTQILKDGCNYFQVENDSDDEIASLKSIVSEVASSAGVDERFVLAIMLQESNGCVRAPTTSYSVQNPGLFQSHEGTGSCNNDSGVQTPCPESEMKQMVEDGVEGTASGDGLKQLVAKCAGKGAQTFYEAARMYNSGSIDPSGNLGLGVATHCYASDIANRLIGWSESSSTCDSTTVGQ